MEVITILLKADGSDHDLPRGWGGGGGGGGIKI